MKKTMCFIALAYISGFAQEKELKEIKALTKQAEELDRHVSNGKPGKSDGNEVETGEARIEQVLKSDFDGYINMHYLATWKDQKIVIQDPIHTTDYEVGDKIYFLVMRHDMKSRRSEKPTKLISFMVR